VQDFLQLQETSGRFLALAMSSVGRRGAAMRPNNAEWTIAHRSEREDRGSV
jgi:hypothetical protein